MTKTLKTKVDGQCQKCGESNLIVIRDAETYKPLWYKCKNKNCDWREDASEREVKIEISQAGAKVIGQRLLDCQEKDILEVSIKNVNLLFIIKKK